MQALHLNKRKPKKTTETKVNKKNRKAQRLIIPSQKTASIPHSSENKAPDAISKSGVDKIKISKIEFDKFILFFLLQVWNSSW